MIVVDGKTYEVSEFKEMHKGGDIFVCDSDMTEKFYSKHESEILKKVEEYIVN